MQSCVQIPWQCAVYTRRNARENYVFSHVERTTVSKYFPSSLCTSEMAKQPKTNTQNIQHLKKEPVLILVTGDWAEEYALQQLEALESTDPSRPNQLYKTHPPPNTTRYDHLRRLGARTAGNNELTCNFYSMEYHSTMAQFNEDEAHRWRLASVIPFLSDMVVLPKTLHSHSCTAHKARTHIWRPLMRSFQRAIGKTLKDSLFIAGQGRYKEDTLDIIRKCTQASPQE